MKYIICILLCAVSVNAAEQITFNVNGADVVVLKTRTIESIPRQRVVEINPDDVVIVGEKCGTEIGRWITADPRVTRSGDKVFIDSNAEFTALFLSMPDTITVFDSDENFVADGVVE